MGQPKSVEENRYDLKVTKNFASPGMNGVYNYWWKMFSRHLQRTVVFSKKENLLIPRITGILHARMVHKISSESCPAVWFM